MSCAALSNSSARMAMQQLRNYPHFLARPIALCFVFEPADKQFFAASLLQLGFVLDTALSKTSEPLLAMIRLKWWIDALQLVLAHIGLQGLEDVNSRARLRGFVPRK